MVDRSGLAAEVIVKAAEDRNANEVFEDLLKQGVIVRSMTSYGYPDCIRINVGLHQENVRMLEELTKVIYGKATHHH